MSPRLICLDFDGTLSEIAPTPQKARMVAPLRSMIHRLSLMPDTRVAILSGRSVVDLRKKVRLPGIVYVGNHGLDIFPVPRGWGRGRLRGWTREARVVQGRLEPLLERWPGALLEAKGPDLSLHYRGLTSRQAEKLIPEAIRVVRGSGFVPRHGKRILEFRPREASGKGEALERLVGLGSEKGSKGICLYVGDDRTDEDAFLALRRRGGKSLGLKVGPGRTLAHFRLRDIRQVRRFLGLFLRGVERS